ncbi:MAG: LuxR family transcriptional regulator, partial [Chloroflexi bacterium]|nr:LuxR family transcriptional regulator [Chloroflexota bacterium]
MNLPFLATKCYLPETHPGILARERLAQKLDAGLQPGKRLLLLCAPAGYGKTSLVSAWVRGLAGPPAVWLSLDEGDNDPGRFWAYCIRSLQSAQPGFGEDLLAILQSPQPFSAEAVLPNLINAIAAYPQLRLLVLDDYHLVKAAPVHDSLAFFIDHLPPHFRLALLSRSDPPLALARLRARQQLVEIRISDLRFTAQESAVYLRQLRGLALSDTDLAALEQRTEGWITGLQLAALSMQDRPDVDDFLRSFSGSNTYVLDYLTEEVIDHQSAETRQFLVQTSLLERLSAELCNAVTGRDDSQALLEGILKNNLFLIPLDQERHWFRYHHLFADLLQTQLERVQPGLAGELHRRAGAWYAAHGFYGEAIRHLLAAGEVEQAAGLVEQKALTILFSGEMMTIAGWLEALPAGLAGRHPYLNVYQAWIHFLTGRLEAIDPFLQAVEDQLPDQAGERRMLLGHVAALRAYRASIYGDATAVMALTHQALEALPPDELQIRSIVCYIQGSTLLMEYQLPEAMAALASAGSMGAASGNIHIAVPAISALGGLYAELGQLTRAADTLRQAYRLASDAHGRPLPLAARALAGMSFLAYEHNDLESAASLARQGVHLARLWGNAETLVNIHLALGNVLLAQGDLDGAAQALQAATQVSHHSRGNRWMQCSVQAFQVRLWLRSGPAGLE